MTKDASVASAARAGEVLMMKTHLKHLSVLFICVQTTPFLYFT